MSPPSHQFSDRAGLLHAIGHGFRPKYLMFWGHTGDPSRPGPHVLSQWWPAAFTIDDVTYPTAEHYMMAEKARLFADEAALARVLAATSPGAAKAAGRAVKGFHDTIWADRRFEIVVKGNIAKFGQNQPLATYLQQTGTKVLVEASPVDRIWGIGLAKDDAKALDPAQWKGQNLLGFALMHARQALTPSSVGSPASRASPSA